MDFRSILNWKENPQHFIIFIIALITVLIISISYLLLSSDPIYKDFINLGLGYTSTTAAINASNLTYSLVHTNINYFSTYASQSIQMSEVAATTLLGLYAIVFIQFIKEINEDTHTSETSKHKKYVLIIFAALPLAFILSSIINLFSIFKVYTNILWASTNYLAYGDSIDIYNHYATHFNGIGLIVKGQLLSDMTTFPNLLINDVYNYILIGLGLVLINLFIYWMYKARNKL